MKWLPLVLAGTLLACSGDDGGDKTPTDGDTDTDTDTDSDTDTDTDVDTDTDTDTDTGTAPPDPAIAAAEALYDPDHVVVVDITIDIDDAEALSLETNHIFDLLEGEDCLDAPWSGPFNWYPADVEVDGEMVAESAVRKKGLIGSLSTEKPSLKVDFDKYVDEQTWNGLGRMTLNNSISDGTYVKQCLGYQLFRDAGIPAPRCNFATLSANEDPLGIYVNVEPLKKDFLDWAFDGDDDGDLYEGTLSDFRAGWTNTFEADTNSTDPARLPILQVTAALEIVDDDAMLDALDEVLDVDAFMRFWAMEVLVAHVDGYAGNTNNFYIYKPENSDQLVFLPWGIDAIFWQTSAFGSDTTLVTLNNTALTRRLWDIPAQRQRYLDTLQELLDTVWDEDALLAEIDRMVELTAPYALDDGGRQEAELEYLRAFITGRRAELEAAMAAESPTFDIPLREGICLIESGDMTLTITTPWGNLDSPDPLSEGASRLTGTIDTEAFDLFGGAIAGESYGVATIAGIALLDGDTVRYAAVEVYADDLFEGARIPLNGSPYAAIVADVDFLVSEEAVIVGSIWDGELVIETYSGVPGEPFAATIEGTVFGGGPY